jgi:predicted ATPase/class 3 adenylate cyclase
MDSALPTVLPTGNVTLVFTDIEGSTALVTELGDRYADLLGRHRKVLRTAFRAHGGVEVGTEGDSFFVAFGQAADAVASAVEAQRGLAATAWPNGCEVRVRVGVHTGTPSLIGGDYVGLDVHRAARIMAAAHGGQIVVSESTIDHVGRVLPNGVTVRDLGDHRLKDLTHAQRLYDLVIEGVDSAFPPLRTLENRPTNLPTQATPLLGRDRELAELAGLLADPAIRAITLTGPGGVGKTHLAMQLAAEQVERFAGGVYFVNLAVLDDPGFVLPTIAQTLGVAGARGEETAEQLARFLADRTMLVVVDNFEHVMAAAPALGDIVRRAPNVRWLATSRASLRITGEHEYPVAPLDVPGAHDPLERLSHVGSVRLFVERARAVRPDFVLSEDNVAAVAAICRDLDGLPLALELAAARLRMMSADGLQARLDDRLRILTGGMRDAPQRQQTLRAAIEWSHDLLSESGRTLFARLGVFDGGWSYEAAEEICGDGLDVFDDLGSLVENSLVRHDESAGGSRFSMLATILSFARERFSELEDSRDLDDRHARFFRDRAAGVRLAWLGDSHALMPSLQADVANFRRAIDHYGELEDYEAAASMTGDLGWFWQGAMEYELSDRLAARLLTHRSSLTPTSTAHLLMTLGGAALDLGRMDEALPLMAEATELLVEADEPATAAFAAKSVAWVQLMKDDPVAAREWFERAQRIAAPLGNDANAVLFEVEFGLARIMVAEGETEGAGDHIQRMLELAVPAGEEAQLHAETYAAEWRLMEGRYGDALTLLERARERIVALGMRRILPDTQLLICTAHLLDGDIAAVRGELVELVVEARERGAIQNLAWGLALAAGAAVDADDPQTAAMLLGACAGLVEQGGAVWPTLQLTLDYVTPVVVAALGDTEYAAAFDRGAHAPIDEMTELATR